MRCNNFTTLLATAYFVLFSAPWLQASFLFSESFNYSVGAILAGQDGGAGFSSEWGPGNSTIVTGFGGLGNAANIGLAEPKQLRTLNATTNTSGQSLYFTYLMNVSAFGVGNYSGLSLWNDNSQEMFFGVPWLKTSFGFDARAGNGEADIKTINFSPELSTTYLFIFGLLPSITTGKVDVKLWATDDFGVNVDSLVIGEASASLLGVKNNFSFNRLGMNGYYSNSLTLAGVAASSNVSEAASLTISAIPEPSTCGLLLVAGAGALWWVKRSRFFSC